MHTNNKVSVSLDPQDKPIVVDIDGREIPPEGDEQYMSFSPFDTSKRGRPPSQSSGLNYTDDLRGISQHIDARASESVFINTAMRVADLQTRRDPVVQEIRKEPNVKEVKKVPVAKEIRKEPTVQETKKEPVGKESKIEQIGREAKKEPAVKDAKKEPILKEAAKESVVKEDGKSVQKKAMSAEKSTLSAEALGAEPSTGGKTTSGETTSENNDRTSNPPSVQETKSGQRNTVKKSVDAPKKEGESIKTARDISTITEKEACKYSFLKTKKDASIYDTNLGEQPDEIFDLYRMQFRRGV